MKPETLQELRGEIQNACRNIPKGRCVTLPEMY